MMPPRVLCSFPAVALCALVASQLGAPRSADACSCKFQRNYGFLVERDGELPANARGLVWAGSDEVSDRDFDVVRVTDEGEIPVPFELVKLQRRLVLVRLTEPTTPGQRYRFRATMFNEYRARYTEGGEDSTFVALAGGRLLVHQIEMVVSEDALELPATGLKLRVSRPEQTSIGVSAPRSCSETIEASVVQLAVVLPKRLQKFAGHLGYRTLIDGQASWNPAGSVCTAIPEGRTWAATGEDTVYAGCDPGAYGDTGLARGKHDIAVEVTFYGSDEAPVRTRSKRVNLHCKEVAPRGT